MGAHESVSRTDEWFTPAWVFEALNIRFRLDPCCARNSPAQAWCSDFCFSAGLELEWTGHVWLNPPFGKRNAVVPWLEKMVAHGDGIALLPNRTGADWWQDVAERSDLLLFHRGKIRFMRADRMIGDSPGFGNVFMAFGDDMRDRLFFSKLDGLRRQ